MKPTSSPHRAKKPLIIVAAVLCAALTLAVLAGAGDALVYTLTALAMASIGGVIYLVQNTTN